MGEPIIKINNPLDTWLAEFRPILEVFLDAYCVVDISGNVVDFNIAFSELAGESHRKILKIGAFSNLIHIKSDINPVLRVLIDGKALRLDEVQGQTKAHQELKLIVGAVPIFSKGRQIVGALITMRNVTAEDALQHKYEGTKKESITDGLTGLYNKIYMEEQIAKAIKISLRELKPISVIMADIDHFKSVNDKFGHQAGDYVLKLVSGTLKGIMRETDIAGRFGGEEFIVLLNNCPAGGAHIFAERLRKAVETTLFIFDGKRIPVTISQGFSTLNQAWQDGLQPEKLFEEMVHQADTALYKAKAEGRNRVIEFKNDSSVKVQKSH